MILDTLLQNHVNSAAVLRAIESSVLPEVTYSGFTFQGNGTMQLSGSVPNLEKLAEQIVALRTAQPAPQSVTLSKFARDSKTGQTGFYIIVEFSPSVVHYAGQ
jgi:hypothetical protein